MRVIVIYLLFLFIGQAVSVGVGLLIDPFSKTAAIATFIPLYYAMYWIAWRLALYVVERSPRAAPASTDGEGGSRPSAAAWLLAPTALAVELCD